MLQYVIKVSALKVVVESPNNKMDLSFVFEYSYLQRWQVYLNIKNKNSYIHVL